MSAECSPIWQTLRADLSQRPCEEPAFSASAIMSSRLEFLVQAAALQIDKHLQQFCIGVASLIEQALFAYCHRVH
eukprot:2687105-Pleurochrysis_carterae.AAC.9